jgi:hypothetical protein
MARIARQGNRQGNIESDDDEWIAFLVALTDPDRRKRWQKH